MNVGLMYEYFESRYERKLDNRTQRLWQETIRLMILRSWTMFLLVFRVYTGTFDELVTLVSRHSVPLELAEQANLARLPRLALPVFSENYED